MQGHGYAPPPPRRPSTVVLVVLRVIFVAVPIFSIGFLAWVAPLRAAIVTRKRGDWLIFAGSLAALCTSFAFLATDHTDDFSTTRGNVGMTILLLNAAASAGYYLYADIRHYRPYPTGYPLPQAPGMNYGYPQPPTPYAAALPQTPVTPVPAPAPAPSAAVPPPPPQRPAPARIDQVRAELDELSDYLRQHPGHTDGGHEGGR